MIVRIYKKYYLELPESEMTGLDGVVDGIILVLLLLISRAVFNLVIV